MEDSTIQIYNVRIDDVCYFLLLLIVIPFENYKILVQRQDIFDC